MWLVAPANSTHFHPIFIKELDEGRYMSTSKKPSEARRLEILNYTIAELLKLVTEDPNFWLSKATISIVTVAILKARKFVIIVGGFMLACNLNRSVHARTRLLGAFKTLLGGGGAAITFNHFQKSYSAFVYQQNDCAVDLLLIVEDCNSNGGNTALSF